MYASESCEGRSVTTIGKDPSVYGKMLIVLTIGWVVFRSEIYILTSSVVGELAFNISKCSSSYTHKENQGSSTTQHNGFKF